MPKMAYPGASEGERAETGEREPKGATASDRTGTKSKRTVNGVGMGKADSTGNAIQGVGRGALGGSERGEFNTGRSESTCYSHKRVKHSQG